LVPERVRTPTTILFYSNRVKKAAAYDTKVTRTRRNTELKGEKKRKEEKTDKPDGKPVLCQRTFSSALRSVFFTQLNCTV